MSYLMRRALILSDFDAEMNMTWFLAGQKELLFIILTHDKGPKVVSPLFSCQTFNEFKMISARKAFDTDILATFLGHKLHLGLIFQVC